MTLWRTIREPEGRPSTTIETMDFSPATAADLEDAHDASADGCNAIEELQATELWQRLPIETRRALCAAHAHLAALADTLATVV